MAASIADYDLRPLTHMEAEVGYGMRTWRSKSLARESAPARDLAEVISQATCVNQPGIGTWTAGKDIVRALMNLFHLEYLAQANLIAARLPSRLFCQKGDSDKMWRQFAGWDHYVEFFHSLDPGPLPHPAAQSPSAKFEAHAIKEAVGLSCKALWERDTLVAFLEHVSHRLPQDNRLIISAAKNFGTIGPADMCVLDYNANWLDGPKPPGFKWFHAQIIEERPDVQAIVHTHDLYGRIYALSGQTLSPIFRVGLEVAMRETPIYPRCDLMIDADVRRKAVDLLDKGPIIHEACHGTDFVAPTLEEALVDSIQREAFLEMDHLARRFGEPKSMPTDLELVKQSEASAEDWWWFYTAEIGAPRRSVAGL
jgi:ribulose-5-phosphate 4-epimerase/fuculose-1-phosphate aldolase